LVKPDVMPRLPFQLSIAALQHARLRRLRTCS
jgi:hypothetical protein